MPVYQKKKMYFRYEKVSIKLILKGQAVKWTNILNDKLECMLHPPFKKDWNLWNIHWYDIMLTISWELHGL